MEFRHLKSFLAVAETGHVGRAARKLHMSQPPLSRHIQQLEAALGVELFVRTPSGMELTDAGVMFVDEARNLLELASLARERAALAGQGAVGRLDIGIFGSAVFDAIPRILHAFRRAAPGVRLALHSMGRAEQIEALRQRRISVAFNRLLHTEPDLETRLVQQEQLHLAASSSSPFLAWPRLQLADLAGEDFIVYPAAPRPSFVDYFQNLCRQRGFEPRIVQEVGDTATGVALVAAGFGSCIVPASVVRLQVPGVGFRRLDDDPALTVDLSILYRRGDPSPLLAKFIASVEDFTDAPT
ncbi:MAG: LysR family transcriptional regulator [Gammaproteobacteria bacterium]